MEEVFVLLGFLSFFFELACIISFHFIVLATPHGVWILIPSSRDRTHALCIGRQSRNHWATEKPWVFTEELKGKLGPCVTDTRVPVMETA